MPTTGGSNPTTGGGIVGSGSLMPNARLQNGRYIVDKILGSGGMGTAVLAKDTRVSNKIVVIKELVSDSNDKVQFQEDVRNFEREVETLSTLDHPLIPAVTDSFQEGTRYFMVQEYVSGENLETHLDRLGKAMPEREVLTYAAQVLDIMDYLAQQTPPIVHRDIKPANIIIGSKDKRAHLVDFGIARADVAKNTQKKQTSALGTPGYAPPEQYQGNADARSDLYALAATMHHLLTNRDPRDFGPFSYPPARSVNPQISPETEQMLTKALTIDVNKRYRNPAEMRQRVEEILRDRFKVAPDTSMYMFATSGSMTVPAVPPTPPPHQQPQPVRPQPQPQFPPPRPVPPRQNNNNGLLRGLGILAVVVILILAILIVPLLLTNSRSGNSGTTTASTPSPEVNQTAQVESNGIGASLVNGELIGLSDGTLAFDTSRPDGDVKTQAAQKLKDGDNSAASSLFRSALTQESNDAEALIYLENLRVQSSGLPHITLIAGVMLTGSDSAAIQAGRDALQGMYVAQKEFNANNGAKLNGTLVRILIANAGSSSQNAKQAAQQIVKLAQSDKTVIGVSGWPYSSFTQNALDVLSSARIPMLSGTASSDDLTDASPYFFRVAPPNTFQAQVGAQYALNKLQAKEVAVFVDQSDSYSRSLADAFRQQYQKLGGTIQGPYQYTRGDQGSVTSALQSLASQDTTPGVIYFSGYSGDVAGLMNQVAANPKFANTKILGGDALYNLGGYTTGNRAGYDRLHFTAFAYPDEWDVLGFGGQKPGFFADYGNAFDPNKQHKGSPYGFTRPAFNVMLAYDATLALITAGGKITSSGKQSFSGADVRQALLSISGNGAIQGVSGQIAFGSNGDPVDKAVVVIYVDQNGNNHMENQLGSGKFLVNS
ncbi:hypothetical protein KSX_28560 [Ktedonospora formicarum]|uniref:non-specific serine/threonine protein kinase n=2 Tax=Ktedonospora formicarum TaxID=2778364 RepID=A0A8J3I106_9CHLR|nr:hypothetical protein KSX_28560 [Ktedonospora formicarum]